MLALQLRHRPIFVLNTSWLLEDEGEVLWWFHESAGKCCGGGWRGKCGVTTWAIVKKECTIGHWLWVGCAKMCESIEGGGDAGAQVSSRKEGRWKEDNMIPASIMRETRSPTTRRDGGAVTLAGPRWARAAGGGQIPCGRNSSAHFSRSGSKYRDRFEEKVQPQDLALLFLRLCGLCVLSCDPKKRLPKNSRTERIR